MRTHRHLASAAALLAVLVTGAGTAQAQQSIDRVVVRARASAADSLASRADTLSGRIHDWRRAASLYVLAAGMRDDSDPRGVEHLLRAAYLYHGTGDARTASWLLERAGTRAESRGDVVAAAAAYVDVGLLALETRQPDRAEKYAHKAETLASSPLLSAEQRDRILSRTGYRELAVAFAR